VRQIYYRMHWADSPRFAPENAWSALWSAERSADGSRSRCETCTGTGSLADGLKCDECDGDGWLAAVLGYSACRSAADLIRYLGEHVGDVAAVSRPGRTLYEACWSHWRSEDAVLPRIVTRPASLPRGIPLAVQQPAQRITDIRSGGGDDRPSG
jgi:hypothetical protein